MRILHLDTGSEWRGGQQQVLLLHRELIARGVESKLLAAAGSPLIARSRTAGLPAEELFGRRPWDPRTLGALRRAAGQADLVHAHDSHALALAAVAKWLRPALRVVGHRRVSYPPGGNPLSRWKYRRADLWVAVSAEIAGVLADAGFRRERVRVVHSAIDGSALRREAAVADQSALRRSLALAEGAPVIGFCAAFSRQKGHGVLVEAAPRILADCPEAVFLLAGEGETRQSSIRSVEEKGIGASFRFPGFRTDVAALTSLFTVAVVPSVDGEGSSASIKEPLALGIPVVASDLAGNLEVLGEAGLAFRNRDASGLAQAVIRILKEPALRAQLAERAAARGEAFAPGLMAEGVLAAYRELVDWPGRGPG